MTADERYARCKTVEELEREYDMNIRSSNSWEYLNACGFAYKKHLSRLLKEGAKENDVE